MRIQRTALIACAATLAACGATSSPTVSPPSPSATVAATPSPTPARPSFEPLLLGFPDTDSKVAMLMLASGKTTAPMPSGPVVAGDATLAIYGPFGARMIGTDGQQGGSSSRGPVSIVALSSDGTLTTLEKNIPGSRSVVGRDDGEAWGWDVQTNSPTCGSSTAASFDIYTDDGTGARKIGSASFGAGVTQVRLVSWTSAGIVAQGDNDCGGPGQPSTLAIRPAILIDASTGAATTLASRIGADCNFEGTADDGTMVCSVAGSAPALRVIAPDGTQTNYSISTLTAQGSSLPRCIDGALLSADAHLAAVALSCPGTGVEGLVILDLTSGHVAVVTGNSLLTPTLWTPDDVLVASRLGAHETYSVATSGMATLINSQYVAQTSVN